jgi:hypothetical protein
MNQFGYPGLITAAQVAYLPPAVIGAHVVGWRFGDAEA